MIRLPLRFTAWVRSGAGSSPADWAVTFGWLIGMLTTMSLRQGLWAFPGVGILLLSIAAWAPLLVRTRWPLAALVATTVLESIHLSIAPTLNPTEVAAFMGEYQPVPLATMLAAYTVADRQGRLLPGVAAAGVLLTAGLLTRGDALHATDTVVFLLVLLSTATGTIVAARRERLLRRAQAVAADTEQAVVAERLRIARELHDVLAHNLTLVNAQAGVAEYLIGTDPQAASRALANITRHTARAIDELRATVGLLRHAGDDAEDEFAPVPDLTRMDELLEGFRAAGTPVELAITGNATELTQQSDLAAYRIIQEALTNATKHAPGASVQVQLDWKDAGLVLSIRNAGRRSLRGGAAQGTGHGLIGMRERALSAGGTLRAQPLANGGFVVEATLPTRLSTGDTTP